MTNIASESLSLRNAHAVLAAKLRPCPSAGRGVHPWLFCAALALKQAKHSETVAFRAIRQAVEHCGREVPDREIEDAVQSAFNSRTGVKKGGWPKKNTVRIAQVAASGRTLAELSRRSPVDPSTLTTEHIIDALFPGDPATVLICAGSNQRDAVPRPKRAYDNTCESYSFIVPNPMNAIRGTNKKGKSSFRCLSNVDGRRFLVVESDPPRWEELSDQERRRYADEQAYKIAKKNEAAAVLWHLADCAPSAPLALVVDSGGKSIHGWFYVAGQPEERCRKFFRYAVALGADSMLWTRCQLVRMPNGTRDNGQRQPVLYFNPNYTEVQ